MLLPCPKSNRMLLTSGGAGNMNRGDSEPSSLIRMWDLQMIELSPDSAIVMLRFRRNLSYDHTVGNWAKEAVMERIQVWDPGTGDLIHEFKDHKVSDFVSRFHHRTINASPECQLAMGQVY